MNIQIEQFTKSHGYVFMTLSCEKTKAEICVGPNEVRVVNKNASHRAWGGMGRGFKSFKDARDGYKSSDMKSIIDAAEKLSA